MTVAICMLFVAQTTNAQAERNYADSNLIDTVSMRHIETIQLPDTAFAEESTGYDDQDDDYVDTTVKHIYDTSQFFFNWKSYYTDAFRKEKSEQRHLIDSEVNALKKDDNFWYIPAIEKLELRIKNDPQLRDSLFKKHITELTDQNQLSFLYEPWFNTLLLVIIIGIFAAAIIYFLIQNKINIFSKEAASSTDETTEDEHGDIFQPVLYKAYTTGRKRKRVPYRHSLNVSANIKVVKRNRCHSIPARLYKS